MRVKNVKSKDSFHYEREMEHSLSLLLILPRLKSKQALYEAKKINKTKNTLFHALSGNWPQGQKQSFWAENLFQVFFINSIKSDAKKNFYNCFLGV